MSIKPRNENPGGKASSDIKKKSKDDIGSSKLTPEEFVMNKERPFEERVEEAIRRSEAADREFEAALNRFGFFSWWR